MLSSLPTDATPRLQPLIRLATALLLVVGLLGHLYAAHAMGGSQLAYTHHAMGFVIILVVTGGIMAAAGWRFWRSHRELTLLMIGLVQALIGLWIAAVPFRGAGGA
ncbi:MAG: hypothetical protein V4617_03455 [Gemmatimonadota bacterium]